LFSKIRYVFAKGIAFHDSEKGAGVGVGTGVAVGSGVGVGVGEGTGVGVGLGLAVVTFTSLEYPLSNPFPSEAVTQK
jgi:hypothetical protein